MKHRALQLAAVTAAFILGDVGPAIGGSPADKATGEVVTLRVVEEQPRWHRFDFAAQESDGGVSGNGFLVHQRLNVDGTEVVRTEFCEIRYVTVASPDAWFAGPIVYDSDMPAPTRWFVLQVHDGGKPRAGADELWWDRVETEDIAREMVESMSTPETPAEIMRGNLKVHAYR